MASLAVQQWKCNRRVAGAAILSIENLDHGILCLSLLDPDKDLRVTDLATVPDSMLLVREDDLRHLTNLGSDLKVLGLSKSLPFDRQALNIVYGPDKTIRFCLFPIDTIAKTLFRQFFGSSVEIILLLHILPLGMAPLAGPALLQIRLVTGLENLTAFNSHPPIMASAAVKALHIVNSLDTCGIGLHRKSYIHVTDPAGELQAMDPVIKDNRSNACLFRVITQNDLPIIWWLRSLFLYTALSKSKAD